MQAYLYQLVYYYTLPPCLQITLLYRISKIHKISLNKHIFVTLMLSKFFFGDTLMLTYFIMWNPYSIKLSVISSLYTYINTYSVKPQHNAPPTLNTFLLLLLEFFQSLGHYRALISLSLIILSWLLHSFHYIRVLHTESVK